MSVFAFCMSEYCAGMSVYWLSDLYSDSDLHFGFEVLLRCDGLLQWGDFQERGDLVYWGHEDVTCWLHEGPVGYFDDVPGGVLMRAVPTSGARSSSLMGNRKSSCWNRPSRAWGDAWQCVGQQSPAKF